MKNANNKKGVMRLVGLRPDQPPQSRRARKVKSFVPDQDVQPLLALAEKHGVIMGELVNAALRAHGKAVLRDHARRLRASAEALERGIGGTYEDTH